MTPAAGGLATSNATALEHVAAVEEQLRRILARARTWSVQTATTVHPHLDPALYAVLMVVVRQGPVRASDLAAERGVSKSVISRQVCALEDLGLVTRTPDQDDARAQSISLSADGRKAARTIDAARRKYLQQLLDGLTVEQLAQIATSLATLNDVLD